MANQSQTAKNSKTHEGDASVQINQRQAEPWKEALEIWLKDGKEALEMAREDGLIPDENGICPGDFFEPISGYLFADGPGAPVPEDAAILDEVPAEIG